jgi:hypothetical protein
VPILRCQERTSNFLWQIAKLILSPKAAPVENERFLELVQNHLRPKRRQCSISELLQATCPFQSSTPMKYSQPLSHGVQLQTMSFSYYREILTTSTSTQSSRSSHALLRSLNSELQSPTPSHGQPCRQPTGLYSLNKHGQSATCTTCLRMNLPTDAISLRFVRLPYMLFIKHRPLFRASS